MIIKQYKCLVQHMHTLEELETSDQQAYSFYYI